MRAEGTSAAGAASMHRCVDPLAGRLILHGRYTCKARRPECWRCPIRDVCRFKDKTTDGER
jgi:endonuclease III